MTTRSFLKSRLGEITPVNASSMNEHKNYYIHCAYLFLSNWKHPAKTNLFQTNAFLLLQNWLQLLHFNATSAMLFRVIMLLHKLLVLLWTSLYWNNAKIMTFTSRYQLIRKRIWPFCLLHKGDSVNTAAYWASWILNNNKNVIVFDLYLTPRCLSTSLV